MRRLRLMLGTRWRLPMALLNVLPLPGVGAMLVGRRNAHTHLLRNGILQCVLFVFGAWPLIVPGAVGLVWAVVDAVHIGQASLAAPPSKPAAATS